MGGRNPSKKYQFFRPNHAPTQPPAPDNKDYKPYTTDRESFVLLCNII